MALPDFIGVLQFGIEGDKAPIDSYDWCADQVTSQVAAAEDTVVAAPVATITEGDFEVKIGGDGGLHNDCPERGTSTNRKMLYDWFPFD